MNTILGSEHCVFKKKKIIWDTDHINQNNQQNNMDINDMLLTVYTIIVKYCFCRILYNKNLSNLKMVYSFFESSSIQKKKRVNFGT